MDKKECTNNYNLAISKEAKEIRQKQLDYIVKQSNSTLPSDVIRGMLLLLNNTVDKWEDDYCYLVKRNKEE